MNLFTVRFFQGRVGAANYLQTVHTLADSASSRQIISLSVSADKLQAVSNYTREPRRLVFDCVPTPWISEHLLNGNEEHERYISHYEVRILRDNAVFFTGIIDLSQLKYDHATGVVTVTCYDRLKLLSLYSDLPHLYSLSAGYPPEWILSYFLSDIQQTIPVQIPVRTALNVPDTQLAESAQTTLFRVDYTDMIAVPPDNENWTYSLLENTFGHLYGYRLNPFTNVVQFFFATVERVEASAMSQLMWRYVYRARAVTFFNDFCPEVAEYDNVIEWTSDTDAYENGIQEMLKWLSQWITLTQLVNLSLALDVGSRHYRSSWTGYTITSSYWGSVFPSRLHPGSYYAKTAQGEVNPTYETTGNLPALQAMLMLYNATLICEPNGTLALISKGSYSTTITDIEDSDVVAFSDSRGTQETPDTGTLSILAGDTTFLQSRVSLYLKDFYGSRWSCDATIDNIAKYPLALQARIRIRGKVYIINELERDYTNDEYKVKAWLQDS